MVAHSLVRMPGASGRRFASPSTRSGRFASGVALLLAAMLLPGCASAPPAPVTGAHPAHPQAKARPTAYQPVIGPYASQRPRDPADWREQNERIAPQEKP